MFAGRSGAGRGISFVCKSRKACLRSRGTTNFVGCCGNKGCTFITVLPSRNIDISSCVTSLANRSMGTLLAGPRRAAICATVPGFRARCDIRVSRVLGGVKVPGTFSPGGTRFRKLKASGTKGVFVDHMLRGAFVSIKRGKAGTKTTAIIRVSSNTTTRPRRPGRMCLSEPFICVLVSYRGGVPFFVNAVVSMSWII